VSLKELQSKGIVFKVVPINTKKTATEFMLPLADMQLRHSLYEKAKPHSFTAPECGITMTFKAHICGSQLLINQLLAQEDDEKLMAIQDLIEMAKTSNPTLHTYLMDERLLQALLDLTRHWLHDAMFPIELAALIPELWQRIIRSPFYQCIQFFSLETGQDCDFFEYFVDAMIGVPVPPTSKTPPSSSSSSSPSPNSNQAPTSPIFFNRERKLTMFGLFLVFARKSVPHSFRYSLLLQVSRLVEVVAKYLTDADMKSSSPKAAQEEFLAELLTAQIFAISRAPHATLLPVLTNLLQEFDRISETVLIRALEVLKVLPPPTTSTTISNCNLLTNLDTLTEHDNETISKLATYNWSKYMMFLTSSKPSQHHHQKGQSSFFTSRELSESCTVTSES
jgi:hypothetical protein